MTLLRRLGYSLIKGGYYVAKEPRPVPTDVAQPSPPPTPPLKRRAGGGTVPPPPSPQEVKDEYETKVLHWLIDTLGSLDSDARERVVGCALKYWER